MALRGWGGLWRTVGEKSEEMYITRERGKSVPRQKSCECLCEEKVRNVVIAAAAALFPGLFAGIGLDDQSI